MSSAHVRPLLLTGLMLTAAVLPAQSSQVTDQALVGATPEEWLTYGRDYAETHYSPLDDINRDNVGRLEPVWSWDIPMPAAARLEATPLISNGILYGTGAWSTVFAIDVRTGQAKWTWDPAIVRGGINAGGPSVCCGAVNRGVALYGDKVFVGLLDGRLVALDKETGHPVWSVQTTPIGQDYSITGAPRVVGGKVVIGNSGAEYGVRGYITAYDAETGEQAWRFYVVPGNPADGFESPAMRRAAETWSGQWWVLGGGGTVWDGYAYDPEENLLYVGTGNGSPWARDIRSPLGGDNLYLSSILAINPDNGELVWHYQTTPGDDWDYTAVQPLMLLDLDIDGRDRKVIVQAPKNGFFYVIDRLTGAFISAEKFADDVTWASAIDHETGRPIENPLARYGSTGPVFLSPGPGGAHNWNPMSWNPEAGLVYIPASNSQFLYSLDAEFNYEPGVFNTGVPFGFGRGGGGPEPPELSGSGPMLVARNPATNTEVWRAEGGHSGTLSTGGGLVFAESGGTLRALDAATGELLWESPPIGQAATPVTYEIDGKQYISVLAGALPGGGFGGGGRGGRGGGTPPPPTPPTPPRVHTFVLP